MKKYLYLTSLIGMSAMLAACGGNDDGNNGNNADPDGNNADSPSGEVNEEDEDVEVTEIGDEDADVELSVWLFGATGYPELAEEYAEENPNVAINFQEIEMGDHHNNLFTALSAGSGAPDLALVEVSEIDGYKSAQDQFVNLFDMGAEDLEADYVDWAWENAQNVDGDFLFGLPTDIGPTAMFYRADVFEEAGLPSEPEELEAMLQTWEDYEEAAATIMEETGKPISGNPETLYNAFRDQAPESYFNEEDELILETTDYVRDAFMRTSDMIAEGYVENLGMWTPEWGAGMADGGFAAMMAPAWMQGVIQDNAPDATEWRIIQVPEGGGNWGGSYMTMPDQTEHPDEAYAFMEWLLAPEQQMKSFDDMGLFPSTPSVYDMEDFENYTSDYFGGQATAQVFAESALDGEHVYQGPMYGDVNSEILAGLDDVYDGIDPEEEWEDILNRVEQRISR